MNVPTLTPDQLDDQYSILKKVVWSGVETGRIDKEVWDATVEEAKQKGWLDGPYIFEELEKKFPEGWAPVRRFGIVQSSKLRVIDDFSENATNAAYASQEKLDLPALDHLAWCAAFMSSCIFVKGAVEVRLSDGTVLSGRVHGDWNRRSDLQLMTKTVDLKSAYKQFAIHPEDSKVYGFISNVLPFGASSAVLAFNRVSRLLWRCLVEAGVICSAYFDDFPILDASSTSQVCESAIRAAVRLLGFKCSEDKEVGFSEQTEMLGVVFDTGDVSRGDVKIANKKGRIEALTRNIDELLEAGKVKSSEVPRIFGRLQFAEHHISGRVGKLAMAELRKLEDSRLGVWSLDSRSVEELKLLRFRLCEHPPRVLNSSDSRPSIQIFTDGACEPDKDGRYLATIGGVIFVDGYSEFFGGSLHNGLVQSWLVDKKHIIGLVELYAVILARIHWARFLEGRKVVYYIDNMPAMRALIKGTSSDAYWREVLMLFERAEAKGQSFSWFSRVPSPSNIADGPSRGELSLLSKEGIGSSVPDCPLRNTPICFKDSYARGVEV